MSRILYLLLLLLGAFSTTASAAKKCFSANSICVGESVYAYDGGLFSGVVKEFSATEVTVGSARVDSQNVARKDRRSCSADADGQSLCPGALVQGGKILGVFPTGYVVFQSADNEVTSQRASDFRIAKNPKPVAVKNNTAAKARTSKRHSTEIAYFKNLLERADTAPIEDFLHLWFPEDEVPNTDGYLMNCIDLSRPKFMLKMREKLTDDCKPDLLYSWGPVQKLDNLKNELPSGGDWKLKLNSDRSIWATISPVATYSYGLIPIRFKFKKQVDFTFGYTNTSDAVAVGNQYGLMDFIFDSGEVLESWSFGTPEIYDEIVKDIRRWMSGKIAVGYSTVGTGHRIDAVYSIGVAERGAQDERTLRKNLTRLIEMILNGEGEVRYGPGVPRDRALHFATDKPTYFNER